MNNHQNPLTPNNSDLLTIKMNTFVETGDLNILGDIFARCRERYCNLAYSFLKNDEDVEDVWGEIFLNLAIKQRQGTLNKIDKAFNNWMFSVVKFRCLRFLKRKGKQNTVGIGSEEMLPRVQSIEIGYDVEILEHVYKSLSEKYYTEIIDAYLNGISDEVFETDHGKREGYARDRRYRAREVLKQKYEKLGYVISK